MGYVAKVSFKKMAQHDNFERGCEGSVWTVYSETFYVEFDDTNDLKIKLAEWTSKYFDVDRGLFFKHVENQCENNRFDYCQSEDADGNQKDIDENNPDGYCCDYMFWIDDVMQKVDYQLVL